MDFKIDHMNVRNLVLKTIFLDEGPIQYSNTKPNYYPLTQPGSIWLVGQNLFKRCSVEGKGGPVQERFYKKTSTLPS